MKNDQEKNMDPSFINPHCISAFVICHRAFLLLKRCSPYLKGTWQMVSGGIQEGEISWQAALREIQEETGLSPQSLYSADAVETFYMATLDKITFVPVFVAFVEKASPVVLSPKEHDAYEWLPFEKAQDYLVFSEQRRVMAHINQRFILQPPDPQLLMPMNPS